MSRQVGETWGEWAQTHYTTEGKLRNCRDVLRGLLEKRFGALPAALVQRIEACQDVERLQACLYQVLQMKSLVELQL